MSEFWIWFLTIILFLFLFCLGGYLLFAPTTVAKRRYFKLWKEIADSSLKRNEISRSEYDRLVEKYYAPIANPPFFERLVLKLDKNLLRRAGLN